MEETFTYVIPHENSSTGKKSTSDLREPVYHRNNTQTQRRYILSSSSTGSRSADHYGSSERSYTLLRHQRPPSLSFPRATALPARLIPCSNVASSAKPFSAPVVSETAHTHVVAGDENWKSSSSDVELHCRCLDLAILENNYSRIIICEHESFRV
jgi:hypothetical protein